MAMIEGEDIKEICGSHFNFKVILRLPYLLGGICVSKL